MSRTMCPFPGKTLCGACEKPIQMVKVGTETLAVDPEIMAVVPTGFTTRTTGRRLHSDMCATYRLAAERERHAAKIRQEMTAYNRKPGKKRAL